MRASERDGFARSMGAFRSIKERWAYSGDKRDLRLDLLRGFAVFAMVVDHTGADSSWLYTLTGHNRFFMSVAEVFVFISGMVMGIVYGKVAVRQGLWAVLKKALKRAGVLYIMTVALTLSFAALSSQLGLPWSTQVASQSFPEYVLGVLTLHRTYYLTDVLLLYVLLVAFAGPVLVLVARRLSWIPLLLSWGLWVAWQWWPQYLQLPWTIDDNTVFNFSAWQVLFITALVIGFHREAIARRIARIPKTVFLLVSGALAAFSIGLYLWTNLNPVSGNESLFEEFFGKADVRAGRLLVFTCFAIFAFTLTTVTWSPIKKAVGWLLLPLGQHALAAYGLHLFAVALFTISVPFLFGNQQPTALEGTALQVGGVLLIWSVIMLRLHGAALARSAGRWTRARLAPLSRLRLTRVRASRPARAERTPILVRIYGSKLTRASLVGVLLGAAVTYSYVSLSCAGYAQAQGTAAAGLAVASPSAVPVPTQVPGIPAPSVVPRLIAGGTTGGSCGGHVVAVGGVLTAAVPAASPVSGEVLTRLPRGIEAHTFNSASLGRSMSYYIYFPPGYDPNSGTRYPVLYMLHGISGTNLEWLAYGLTGRADDLVKTNVIHPFLMVLPQGDQGFWIDQANGGPKWGAYVARDLVSEIDSHYPTLADRADRAIGGLSMGGQGALQLAMNFPDVFSIVGAHSPSLHTQATAPAFFGDAAYFAAHDPVSLFAAHPDVARTLKVWIDDGEQDTWFPAVQEFYQQLASEGIQVEWHAFLGGHLGEYWSGHIIDYLMFYSRALYGSAAPSNAPTAVPTSVPTGTPTLP